MRKKMKFKVTIFDIEFEATGDYYPGRPAQISGPPERCYPAEDSEFDLTALTYDDVSVMFLLDSSLDDAIQEACHEKADEINSEGP